MGSALPILPLLRTNKAHTFQAHLWSTWHKCLLNRAKLLKSIITGHTAGRWTTKNALSSRGDYIPLAAARSASQQGMTGRGELRPLYNKVPKKPRAITCPWTNKTCIRFIREIRAWPFLGGKVQNWIWECICDVQKNPASASLATLGPIIFNSYNLGFCQFFGWFVFIGGRWMLKVATLTAVRGWVCWSRVKREEGWRTKVILLGLY